MTDAPQPLLRGGRVRLEPLEERHLERSLEWVNAPHIMRAVLRVLPVTWEDQRRWHAAIQADPARLVWAIHDQGDDAHLGNTGLYHIDRLHRRAEFWIYLGDPGRRGRGAGGEALRLVRAFAFETLGLERLFLHVAVDNQPALNLYTRHGFLREGVLRGHYRIDGAPVDVAVMSQLKSEYDQQKHR